MKKIRRILIVSAVSILGLLLVLIALPFLFEDELKIVLKKEVNQQLNAVVEFEDIDLSFIRSFPDATISVLNYSIANTAPFAGDTLISGKEMAVTVNLSSIFSGEEYQIHSVTLDQPRILVKVLTDGSANYDITIPYEGPEDTTAASPFKLALDEYEVIGGNIRYLDQTLPMAVNLAGFDHSGSGNFSDEDFLLSTVTAIQQTTIAYDGTTYLKALPFSAKVDLDIHAGDVLTVKMLENEFLLNQFPLAASGEVSMPGDDINMDLAFSSPGSDFQTLLSLVPEVFKSDLAGFKATGGLTFDGSLSGTYNETSFPGYGLNLNVKNGSIQYPDLPESISKIDLDLAVANPDGKDESLKLDLNTFTALLGSHPLEASLHLQNMITPYINGNARASVDLADITKIYPLEGTSLAGNFSLDADAKGTYNEAAGTFPQVKADMKLTDGFIQSEEYNTRLTEFSFNGTLTDPDGSMSGAALTIPQFHFLLDGVPMDGSLSVVNFDDPAYEVQGKGALDLGKMFQLYPIDSMELSGVLTVNDIYAKGVYSDLEAERYDKLVNRGSVEIQSLYYRDLWYTQPGVSLTQGTVNFTPDKLAFDDMAGKLGKSSFSGSGYLTNYLAYLLMGSDELQGNITMRSPEFDSNEWLAEDATATASTTPGEEEPLEVYPIPAGYDLLMDVNMGKVLYDDLVLENVNGKMEIKEQQLHMDDVSFNMLGSNVVMGGAYDTRNPDKAGYDFFLDIENLLVKEAFKYFDIVKGFAPAAQYIAGKCNLEVGLKGGLKPDFSPILEDINAFGLFEMLEGGLSQTPMTSALASNTNISTLSTWSLNDIKGIFKIEDGTITVDPFDLKIGEMTLNIGGAQNLAGGIRYNVNIDAPQGSLGAAAFKSLGQLTGGALNPGERVQVNLLVTGTSKEPTVSGAGGGTGSQLANQATTALEGEISNRAGVDVTLNKDSLKNQAAQTKKAMEDSLRLVAAQAKQRAADSLAVVADSAKAQAQRALEEELKNRAGEDVTEKLKALKKRIRLPGQRDP